MEIFTCSLAKAPFLAEVVPEGRAAWRIITLQAFHALDWIACNNRGGFYEHDKDERILRR
jgi:hypothetical protein